MSELKDREEVKVFREYLQIPSVHPDIDYGISSENYKSGLLIHILAFSEPCIKFLKRLGVEIDLPVQVFYPKNPKKPILVMAWPGEDPNLSSIFLNSHMDVVPVFEECWDHPPFGAEMDDDGNIYARGAQDVKCLGIQNYFAIKELIKEGFKPLRTVYLSFSCEEEKGGEEGMMDFVHTDDFKRLNVGFAMDEGGCSPEERFPVFYAERSTWCMLYIFMHLKSINKLNWLLSQMLHLSATVHQDMDRYCTKIQLEKNFVIL